MSILRDNCSSSRATGTRATQLVDPPSLCQEGVRGSHRHQQQRHRHRHHRQDHGPCCRKSQIICQEGERGRYHHPHQRHLGYPAYSHHRGFLSVMIMVGICQ